MMRTNRQTSRIDSNVLTMPTWVTTTPSVIQSLDTCTVLSLLVGQQEHMAGKNHSPAIPQV